VLSGASHNAFLSQSLDDAKERLKKTRQAKLDLENSMQQLMTAKQQSEQNCMLAQSQVQRLGQ